MKDLFRINGLEEKNAQLIKKNSNKIMMNEIIAIIEKNPYMLEKLDISRLEIINEYYKRKIREYKKKIKK